MTISIFPQDYCVALGYRYKVSYLEDYLEGLCIWNTLYEHSLHLAADRQIIMNAHCSRCSHVCRCLHVCVCLCVMGINRGTEKVTCTTYTPETYTMPSEAKRESSDTRTQCTTTIERPNQNDTFHTFPYIHNYDKIHDGN